MTIPATMCGVQLTGHGGPAKLVWQERIPVPVPGPGEVLVRVLAAGVNNTDINTRIGWYAKEVTGGTAEPAGEAGVAAGLGAGVEAGGWGGALEFPRIQGGDLCGEVVALGDDATGLSVGMRVVCANVQPEPTPGNPRAYRVIGSEYDGAFAQFCCVPARHLHDVSASPLSPIEIAAMPCAFGTAENLIDRAGVAEGERVLVTGASGGVGLAAVQLAKLRGARVAAVAGAAKREAVLAAGAEAVLDRDAPIEAQCCDVALDLVGGPRWGALIEALRPGGRYAVAGAIAGPIVEADLRTIYLNDLEIYGCTYQSPEVFARLVSLINAGRVRPLVSNTYPLSRIAAAQEDFVAKRYPGKLVLTPPEVS